MWATILKLLEKSVWPLLLPLSHQRKLSIQSELVTKLDSKLVGIMTFSNRSISVKELNKIQDELHVTKHQGAWRQEQAVRSLYPIRMAETSHYYTVKKGLLPAL
ncbi:hypothetical protein L2E82_05567 [Cichorium intybus]|uniref:Uncharacterized protein n=1 Tax=Cichorium intybus TaxID=13427 RepID=A0ACB9H855_CICIN|nr:hypothetical protein L2E82_05567 [Cichorium intybus]